jgi:hypothetical protein
VIPLVRAVGKRRVGTGGGGDLSGLSGPLHLRGKDLGAGGSVMTTWPGQRGGINAQCPDTIFPATVAASATPTGGKALALNHSRVTLTPFTMSGDGEMWVVIKSLGNDANAPGWKFGTEAGGSVNNYYPYAGTIYDDFGSGSPRMQFSPGVALTNWHLYRAVKNADTSVWFEINNVRRHTVAAGVVSIGWNPNPILSGDAGGGGTHGLGLIAQIAEVFVRDTVSTPAEISGTIIPYFNAEHGLGI